MKLINIGFGNMVMESRIITIVTPDSAPSRRLREEAKLQNRLIDATLGRKNKNSYCHRFKSCYNVCNKSRNNIVEDRERRKK